MAEIVTNRIDELGSFWTGAVYPFVKPIVEADSTSKPSPVGSGVLISHNGMQYLLTAHHVTRPIITEPPYGADGAFYTFLPEQLQISGLNHHVVDPYDLSIIEVPTGPRPSLLLPQHLAFDVKEGELCLLLGFPARTKSWDVDNAHHTLRPAPFSYLGTALRPSIERFSVGFNRKRLSRNQKKYPEIGKLNGISGGGAFVLRNDRPKLAGIIIEYHSNKSEIVCTSSVAIWSMVKGIAA